MNGNLSNDSKTSNDMDLDIDVYGESQGADGSVEPNADENNMRLKNGDFSDFDNYYCVIYSEDGSLQVLAC